MRKPSSICPWMSVHSCGSFSPRARHPKRVPIRVLLNDYALETHRGSRPANATAIRKKLDNDGISRASPKAVWLHGRPAETRHRSIPQPGIGVIRAMPPRVYIFRHLLQRLGVGSNRAPIGNHVFDAADIERCKRLLDEPRILHLEEFAGRHIWDSDDQAIATSLDLPGISEPVLECDLRDTLPDQRFHLRPLGILIEI